MEESICALGWAFLGWFIWLIIDTQQPVYAQEVARVSWDHVTSRENGDVLPPEELLFYEIHVREEPAGESDLDIYDVSSDVSQYDIHLLANKCYTVTAYAAATGSPSCKPEQQYLLSAPSEVVNHCTGDATLVADPNPPRDFM